MNARSGIITPLGEARPPGIVLVDQHEAHGDEIAVVAAGKAQKP